SSDYEGAFGKGARRFGGDIHRFGIPDRSRRTDPDLPRRGSVYLYTESLRQTARPGHAARFNQRLAARCGDARGTGTRRRLRRSGDVFGAIGGAGEGSYGHERADRQTESAIPAQSRALAFRHVGEIAGAHLEQWITKSERRDFRLFALYAKQIIVIAP